MVHFRNEGICIQSLSLSLSLLLACSLNKPKAAECQANRNTNGNGYDCVVHTSVQRALTATAHIYLAHIYDFGDD